MREIKFRAWDDERREMAYITDLYLGDLPCTYLDGSPKRKTTELMQFTGLRDKNGKEIYEGDILVDPDYVGAIPKMVVDWDPYGAGWRPFTTTTFASKMLEIVGNVWENPELLEAK